ncbi:MAG: hypothetical protein ACTHPS_10850 [Streptosporangiaceae bacterium]
MPTRVWRTDVAVQPFVLTRTVVVPGGTHLPGTPGVSRHAGPRSGRAGALPRR